jgi:hypothetical protein
MGFNRVQVEKSCEQLKEFRRKYNSTSQNIYNIDESGLFTVPTKLHKVISPKGTHGA